MNKTRLEFVPVSDEQLIENPQIFARMVPFSQNYQCCHLRPKHRRSLPLPTRIGPRSTCVHTG